MALVLPDKEKVRVLVPYLSEILTETLEADFSFYINSYLLILLSELGSLNFTKNKVLPSEE